MTETSPELGALIRLMTMLSPVFPVGSFSYSNGLEQAVADGLVADTDSLRDWIADLMGRGSTWNDAVLLAECWRAASRPDELAEINELALAMAGSAERFTETTAQGRAFVDAARAWPEAMTVIANGDAAYPVAVGAVAAASKIPLDRALACWLNAYASNLVQVSIRLSVTGQQGGLAVLAALEPLISETASRAASSTLDDLGNSAMLAEIVSMTHETSEPRLFRT